MYKKTGEQLQKAAGRLVVFEIIVSEIVAIVFFFLFCVSVNVVSESDSSLLSGINFIFLLCTLIFGFVIPFFAWQKYLIVAGFGELIENTLDTKNELADIKKILISTLKYDESNLHEEENTENNENVELNVKHIKIISKMHDKGELTDDEFNKLMNEIQKHEV